MIRHAKISRSLVGFFPLALTLCINSASWSETLSETLASAYDNSNLLAQQQATLRAADEGVAQAVATLKPILEYSINANTSRTQTFATTPMFVSSSNSIDLNAILTLLDFGRRDTLIKLQKNLVMQTRQVLKNIEQNILFSAVSAFINLQIANEILSLRKANVKLVEEELRSTKSRFELGEVTRTDIAIAEARLAGARATLTAAQGDLTIARENYKTATGEYPTTRLKAPPAPPALPKSVEDARNNALRNHPNILQAQYSVTVADLGIEAAEANFNPTLTGNIRISRNDKGVDTHSVGMNFSQQIYSGGAKSSAMREAIAQKESALAALKQTRLTILQEVSTAWESLATTKSRIKAEMQRIAAAQTAYDGVREEASLGIRTTLDVLNAEKELLDARVAKVQAVAQQHLDTYRILQSIGQMNARSLQLNVTVYDPEVYYQEVKSAPTTWPGSKRLDRVLDKINK